MHVKFGIDGLDEILLGGVLRGNTVLVEGPAGAGKTTLGLKFIHAGASLHDEPGLVLSFELDVEKLLRDAAGFGWNLRELIDRGAVKIIQTTPEVLFDELTNDGGSLANEISAMGCKRLLIDGLTPLRLFAESKGLQFRADLAALTESIGRLGVTAVVTAERAEQASDTLEHERFVFDTIISVGRQVHRRRVLRRIAVEKSRGQDFIAGNHAMVIRGGEGVQVFRRAQAAPKLVAAQPTSRNRITTGIPELDVVMDGGIYEGSVTMVTGISGTGKTVAGVQFLNANALLGRRGLLVSLDEHPAQILRNAATLGLDLERLVESGQVSIHYESPLELDLDVHFQQITRMVQDKGVECVVFDSIAVYESTSPEEIGDFLYALATHLKSRLATVYFNYESPELLGVSQISEELKGSHLVDNIILLSYVEVSTYLRRAITAPKVRGSRNQQVTREFVIGAGGVTLVSENEGVAAKAEPVPQLPFSSYYGLLSRSPTRNSPLIEEAVASGEKLPESSAPALENP